jgi:hypothetical protein
MAETRKARRKGESLGKYCVAGGPRNVSCKNNSKTEGVSMHSFPSNHVNRLKWTGFVQRHRTQWHPSNSSVLCSVHLQPSDFEQRLDLNVDLDGKSKTKRWLKKGAIPTVDCVEMKPQEEKITSRARRQVRVFLI